MLQQLIELFPNEPWDMGDVASNPTIDPEWFIKKFGWHRYLSANPGLTTQLIRNHINADWNWPVLSESQGVTLELINDFPDKPWFWYCIPIVTLEFVMKHMDKSLNWNEIVKQKFMTMELLMKIPRLSWYSQDLSENENVTEEFVLQHLDWNWNWDILTKKFYSKFIQIRANDAKADHETGLALANECLFLLCRNSEQDIKMHLLSCKRQHGFRMHFPITKYVTRQNVLGFHSFNLACNLTLTEDFIGKYHSFLDWELLSENPIITCDIIERHPNWPWNWRRVSHNPNLTSIFITKFKKKIFFDWLSKNIFLNNRDSVAYKDYCLSVKFVLDFPNVLSQIITSYL